MKGSITFLSPLCSHFFSGWPRSALLSLSGSLVSSEAWPVVDVLLGARRAFFVYLPELSIAVVPLAAEV